MQLFLIDPDNVGSAGAVQVGWCIERELLEEVKDKNPHVLVITAPVGRRYDKSREMRQIVPLKDGMTFVSFRVPGENAVHAMLLSGHSTDYYRNDYLDSDGGAIIARLNRNGDNWQYSLGSAEGELDYTQGKLQEMRQFHGIWPETEPPATMPAEQQKSIKDALANYEENVMRAQAFVDKERIRARGLATVPINVPKEAFAKEPPQWLQTWVNYFWREKPKDDCMFYRRLPLAILVQPFWMLMLIITRLVLTVGAFALGAFPGLSLKAALHPMTYRLKDNFEDIKEPFWAPFSEAENGRDKFNPWKLPLVPLAPPFLLISLWVNASGAGLGDTLLSALIAIVVGAYVLAVAVGVVAGLLSIVVNAPKLAGSAAQLITKMTGGANLDREDLEVLACEGDCPKDVSYDKLPQRRRSLRLRMLNHKAGHCRPWVG